MLPVTFSVISEYSTCSRKYDRRKQTNWPHAIGQQHITPVDDMNGTHMVYWCPPTPKLKTTTGAHAVHKEVDRD